MHIRFGTDGWRAVIAEDFTFENIRHVAQAVAEFIHEQAEDASPSAIVGFDTRFLSDRFAIAVAEVLAGNDVQVIMSRLACPTPVASFAVRHFATTAGGMITASHNPPRYNGFKLKDATGGSASPTAIRWVEERIAANLANGVQLRILDQDQALARGVIRQQNFFPFYLEHLKRFVDLDVIGKAGLRVAVDAMHGSGRGYLRSILTMAGCDVMEIRGDMNPGFGGIYPEPIERNLSALVAAVRDNRCDLGLATDGDADRIGAVDAMGHFVDPQRIFALVLRHLVERRGWRGDVVKTVSTTQLVNSLAARYGLTVHETPVGFNHVADLMARNSALIGGEESGGISIRGHVPVGDGILMGLLLAEIVAYHGQPLHQIVQDLLDDVGPFRYARRDVHTRVFDKRALVSELVSSAPSQIAGLAVVKVNNLDGVKYLLEDDSWLLIRPSGTEPVLRIYAEGRSPSAVEALLEEGTRLGAKWMK